MYKKAVRVHTLLAFAYEVPIGGYALSLYLGTQRGKLETEPEFASIAALEKTMSEIAPLSEWSESLFDKLTNPNNTKIEDESDKKPPLELGV